MPSTRLLPHLLLLILIILLAQAPIFSVLYAGLAETDFEAEGIASLPFVLYQGSQVVMGQATVAILKRWNEREKRRTAEKAGVEGGGKAGV